MLKDSQIQPLISSSTPVDLSPELELHARCGVYTAADQVDQVLDAVGWTDKAALAEAYLLEPACGDGAFVVRAAERLIKSLKRELGKISRNVLLPRIRAYELVPDEASETRRRITAVLVGGGLSVRSAAIVSRTWVRTGDFLLAKHSTRFTHVVGNPPYCRWPRIPAALRFKYEAAFPKTIARGDIFLPFLDKAIESLEPRGILGFVCSDRWQYAAFASGFREGRLKQVRVLRNSPLSSHHAFQRSVDAYSTLLVLQPRIRAPRKAAAVIKRKTLSEAGFRVRVGPALGCTKAFVLSPGDVSVERKLTHPFLEPSDILDQRIQSTGKRIVAMHREDGSLVDITIYPKLRKRLTSFKPQLLTRSIVRLSGANWYAPIDRVRKSDWAKPKLLVPEMAKIPRFARDDSGSIPAHGLYAVFAPSADALNDLIAMWAGEGLSRALRGRAPQVKGGYVRCYKTFLDALPAP